MTDLLNPTAERQPERKSASHGEAGYERKERDFYPTEPWVTRALIAAVDLYPWSVNDRPWPIKPGESAWVLEPACGDGRMAETLREAHYLVYPSDIHDYGYQRDDGGHRLLDFLRDQPGIREGHIAAIVTNPPFDQAVQFILRALDLVKPQLGKVAILQRHEFDAPAKNHPLFKPPFAAKLVLHKRPWWVERKPGDDGPRFPYAWYLWDWRHQGPPILRYLPDPDKPAKAVGELL